MDLYAVNSAVPAEQLEEFVEHLRSQPPHPGRIIRDRCLGGSISVEEAARKLNLEPVELEAVLACEAAVSPALAARLEAAGWSTADVWNNLQANYDRAQTRLRREREGSTSARSESAPGHVGRFAGTRTPAGNRSRRRLRRRG